MKELKNKIDSIRRTLKTKGIEIKAVEIELKILELCPNFPDDWCSDVRHEVIKALTKGKQSSKLAIIEEPVNNLHGEDFATEVLDKNSVNSLSTSDYSIYFASESQNEEFLDTDNMQAIALTEINQNGQMLAVTNADKQALVSTQSLALGFELSEQECLVVADSVDDVFSDYASFLTSVTSAIRGYVDHRFDEVESALDTNADAVRSHIADRTTRLNQKVENFSTNVKADIGGIRQNIKSSKASILSRFALPSKAG